MTEDVLGASAVAETGSREPSPSVSALTGFDPARGKRFTVAFILRDDDAWDAFWKVLRTQYDYRDPDAPVRAFAFSVGDMFAEQAFTDELLNSDLDAYEKCEVIADIPCGDIDALREKWELPRDSDASLAEDRNGLSGEAVAARADEGGIAPSSTPTPEQSHDD